MAEDGEIKSEVAQVIADASTGPDEAISLDDSPEKQDPAVPVLNGEIRTLDGDLAGDEFAADAVNYQILLGKIDRLLERLKLDA